MPCDRKQKKGPSCAASFGRNTTVGLYLHDWSAGAENKLLDEIKTEGRFEKKILEDRFAN